MPEQPSQARIDLSRAGNGAFFRTRSKLYEAAWIIAEALLVSNPLQPSSRVRAVALRVFGARVGRDVILRPRLRVKFPWNLSIGDRSWIGEGVWIHNQATVTIGMDAVISQGTFITTGSHDYMSSMDLVTSPVSIGDGVWITAMCIVLRGVTIGPNVLIAPGSVVNRDLSPGGMYGGNPVATIRDDRFRRSESLT